MLSNWPAVPRVGLGREQGRIGKIRRAHNDRGGREARGCAPLTTGGDPRLDARAQADTGKIDPERAHRG